MPSKSYGIIVPQAYELWDDTVTMMEHTKHDDLQLKLTTLGRYQVVIAVGRWDGDPPPGHPDTPPHIALTWFGLN